MREAQRSPTSDGGSLRWRESGDNNTAIIGGVEGGGRAGDDEPLIGLAVHRATSQKLNKKLRAHEETEDEGGA